MCTTARSGLGCSQELGTPSGSPHGHLSHRLLAPSMCISRKIGCKGSSWDSNPGTQIWAAGVPSGDRTAVPNASPSKILRTKIILSLNSISPQLLAVPSTHVFHRHEVSTDTRRLWAKQAGVGGGAGLRTEPLLPGAPQQRSPSPLAGGVWKAVMGSAPEKMKSVLFTGKSSP